MQRVFSRSRGGCAEARGLQRQSRQTRAASRQQDSEPAQPRTGDASQSPRPSADDTPIRYPENRTLGVLDSEEQLTDALEALTTGGFLESEVEVLCGRATAERLRANTGRTGYAHFAMRLVESIGLPNEELQIKNQYADAIADGGFLVSVFTPSEERQELAARLLREHGGRSVRYFGRYTIQTPRHAD
jgi:hypothetical protein